MTALCNTWVANMAFVLLHPYSSTPSFLLLPQAFFVSLPGRLSSLSPSLVAFRLVRPLLRRFVLVEPSARIHFVPYLLTPRPKDGGE